MSLTSEFREYPLTFLQTKVIIVPHATDEAVKKKAVGVHAFNLVSASKNTSWLAPADDADDSISAYYLPWERGGVTTMDLGGDAPYFFTSHLTGCRFSILEGADSRSPKVAHVAGGFGTTLNKNKAEESAGFAPVGVDAARPRRFSISDGKATKGNPTFNIPAKPQKHQYRGQNGSEDEWSSAFVFGKRQDDESWRFYVQVTKGLRNEVAGVTLADDLIILAWQDLAVRQI